MTRREQAVFPAAARSGMVPPPNGPRGCEFMLQKPKCPIIALEEHYADDELVATYTGSTSIRCRRS